MQFHYPRIGAIDLIALYPTQKSHIEPNRRLFVLPRRFIGMAAIALLRGLVSCFRDEQRNRFAQSGTGFVSPDLGKSNELTRNRMFPSCPRISFIFSAALFPAIERPVVENPHAIFTAATAAFPAHRLNRTRWQLHRRLNRFTRRFVFCIHNLTSIYRKEQPRRLNSIHNKFSQIVESRIR